jgi:hypothetical protein
MWQNRKGTELIKKQFVGEPKPPSHGMPGGLHNRLAELAVRQKPYLLPILS